MQFLVFFVFNYLTFIVVYLLTGNSLLADVIKTESLRWNLSSQYFAPANSRLR